MIQKQVPEQQAARWGDDETYSGIRQMSFAGVLTSGFAEYWNPEDGVGLGAVPQGWCGGVGGVVGGGGDAGVGGASEPADAHGGGGSPCE